MKSSLTCTCKEWTKYKQCSKIPGQYTIVRMCKECFSPHPDDVFYGVDGKIYGIGTKEPIDTKHLRRVGK